MRSEVIEVLAPRRIDTTPQPRHPSIADMAAELRRLAGEAFAAGDDARAALLREAAFRVAGCIEAGT